MTVCEVFPNLIFRRNQCLRAPILNPDHIWWHLGGVGGGNQKSCKMLRVERLGWNLVGTISKCRRYVIDVTGLDTLFGGVWGVQCFGEFGASGHARMVDIGRRVMNLHNFDLIKLFSLIRPSVRGLKGEEKLEKMGYF